MLMAHLLFLVTAFLICGSAGLLFVHVNSPQTPGMGLVGAAFASGALATLLMIAPPDVLGGILPDLALLVALVLMHVAVLSLAEEPEVIPRLGILLLLLEIVTGLCLSKGFSLPHLRIEILTGLVAVQAGQTALQVLRYARGSSRAPAWFVAIDLMGLSAASVSFGCWLGFSRNSADPLLSMAQGYAIAVLLFAALGFTLGFFWLATVLHATGLEEMAGTDSLTRAYNRRNFLQWCEQERERGERNGVSFSVLIVDIDHFKSINDTFGHAVGDTVICDVVDKMRDAVRGIDVVGRWGGEEFVILLRESSIDSALVVAERVRVSVSVMEPSASALRFGKPRPITVSIGIASHRASEPIADLVARADSALYQAKGAGRNCIIACPEDFRASAEEAQDSGVRATRTTV